MASAKLLAPVNGWCLPLAEVPDEVFASGMLGPGVAIDPTGDTLHAPCAGEIASIPASRHAIAIRTAEGVEVLLHVGIDTVGLRGEGFEVLTAVGARVAAGAPLLKFDLDLLARRAKSLITPIVITNGDRFEVAASRTERNVTVGEVLLDVEARQGSESNPARDQEQYRATLVVPAGHGLHARPAAVIAKRIKGCVAELRLELRGRSANARSPVAVMALGARPGDTLTAVASGRDARRALDELQALLPTLSEPSRATARPAISGPERSEPGRMRGVIASPGFAVGRALTLRAAQIAVEEAGRGVTHEAEALEGARVQVRARLETLAHTAGATAREVASAHLEFLDDCELLAAARRAIARGKSAGYAWRSAIGESADALRALGDLRMRERVEDLLDLEAQVLHALTGAAPQVLGELPERAILLAEELQPSQMMLLDATRLAGICLAGGGPTSHVAILAAAMGIPALVALGRGLTTIESDTWLVLDAEQGVLSVAPDREAVAAAEQVLALRQARTLAERTAAQDECRSADGTRVEVFANLGSVAEAQVAVAHGAEGCGLLRTEFLFLDRSTAPSEEEQHAQYQAIARALGPRPLVVRTLDAGGDKPIPYLPLPPEDNPALGLRGVRTGLLRPDLLREQLRAILRIEPFGQSRVLLPMITDPAEIRAIRQLLEEASRELGRTPGIEIGAMIETPAAALNAVAIAREVDFLSIGTNDLTQYTLAMDRGHAELAPRIDGLHPAVLRLIAMTAEAGLESDCSVAVCGGLASEPLAVPILLGLGVRELSVTPALIPRLKGVIRSVSLDACRLLARRVLELDSVEEVRRIAAEFAATEPKVNP